MFILEAFWFFLPILVANQCPGFAARLCLPGATVPVARKWLGDNKTIAAYYAGPIGALATVYGQREASGIFSSLGLLDYVRSDLWLVGIAFGLGAVLGDHVKSFIKRRLGISPGARWWPFDQLDFAVGGIALSMPLVGWIGWERILAIIFFVLLIHPIGNKIGYRLGLRKVPW